jgi:hypothetical protein
MGWKVKSLIVIGLLVSVGNDAKAQCFYCRSTIECQPTCVVLHTCTGESGPCTNCTTQCEPGPGKCEAVGPNGCQWTYRTPATGTEWLDALGPARCNLPWLGSAVS